MTGISKEFSSWCRYMFYKFAQQNLYMVRQLFLVICACGMLSHSLGQNLSAHTIKGTVLDNFGHPLANADIKAQKSGVKAVSDEVGHFELNVLQTDKLFISHIGYSLFQLPLPQKGLLVIRLQEENLNEPEDIDVLYETKKKNNILGSVSSIYTPQLKTTPASLYAYAFAGRIPGLYTNQTAGWTNTGTTAITTSDPVFGQFPASGAVGLNGPSDNTEILLKLRGQMPVTIVDGVQRDIYSISPENIESVSALKDALSTILLGQRSSRGVLLVTTKKPVRGTPHLSFTAQKGIQTPLKLPEPLPAYKYAYLYNEALLNDGRPVAYSYDDFDAYKNHTDPYRHPDVNWFNTILKDNSAIQRYDLNVSGGGNAARYSLGLGYLQQDGLFKVNNPDYNANAQIKRYTINTNIDVNVTPAFNTQLQIYGRIQDGQQPGATVNGIINGLYTTPSNAYPVFNPDGSLGGSQLFTKNLYGMLNNSGYISDYTRDITANLTLKYKFDKVLNGLWARIQSNLSVYASNAADRSKTAAVYQVNFSPAGDTTYNRYGVNSDLNNNFLLTYSAQYWYLQGALGYDKVLGSHSFGTTIFYDRRESIFNFDLPETNQNIAATGNWNYKHKYSAEAAVNYSGNSRFPPGKQFGLFYAFGLGWDITQENFIKNNPRLGWINKIKLRSTYGKTGNANIGYFSWRSSYNTDFYLPTYPFGVNRTISSYSLSQNSYANPNATWEKANKFNIGLDLSFFNNHLDITTEFYQNRYYDLMQLRGKQSALAGINYPPENIGINRYTGFEFSATYKNHFSSFNYYVTGNISGEQSRVLFMDEIKAYPWNARTGHPVGMLFGYQAEGFIQTAAEAQTNATVAGWHLQPGDLKLKDKNEDGVINTYDQVPIGSEKPLIYYGLTLGFNYKGFDVSVLLQGVQNSRYLLGGEYSFGPDGKGAAFDYAVGRWIPEVAAQATYPRLTSGFNNNNDYNTYYGTNANSFWVHSGDYFRIKNIDLGYTLPYKWTTRLKISSWRVFVNGFNLFTHAGFGRVDPEVHGQAYPIQKVVNLGFNLKF